MIGIGDAMTDPVLFGQHFAGGSWDCWKAVLKASFGEPFQTARQSFSRL
jgi:hypothetical protein